MPGDGADTSDDDLPVRVELYRATSRSSGKSYVGMTTEAIASRWRKHLTAASLGSPYLFHKAIRKYGAADFDLERLAAVEGWEKACALEIALIAWHRTFLPGGYNSTTGGEGAWGHVVSAEARLDIGRKVRAKYLDPDYRENHSAGQRRRFSTEEGRAAHAEALAVFWADEGARKAQSERLLAFYAAGGEPHNKGGTASPEARVRMSQAQLAYFGAGGTVWNKGGSFGAESRERMSVSRKRYVAEGGTPTNARPVVIHRVRHDTIRSAADAMGLSYKNMTNRMYRRWPGYRFADEDPG